MNTVSKSTNRYIRFGYHKSNESAHSSTLMYISNISSASIISSLVSDTDPLHDSSLSDPIGDSSGFAIGVTIQISSCPLHPVHSPPFLLHLIVSASSRE